MLGHLSRNVRCALRSACLFLIALQANAQNFGEINGTVTDSSNATVATATVIITNTATNVARRVQTNDSGNYTAPFLPPGSYNVQVEHAGFKTGVRTGIQLQVGDVARIDFALQLGGVSEVVEVSASAAMLSTEGTSVGTVIENRRIVELPLNGRNYLQLIALNPNVTIEAGASGTAGGRQGGERTNQTFSIAGQRLQFNHYTLDGIENTDPNFNTWVFRPSVDAIQEFKTEVGIYSAQYGRQIGQINVTTKSGGNAFHGTLFEFLRNDKMDAREWRQVDGNKNPFRRNQYGFTFGGRILRDRLFFLANYEGLKDRKTTQRVSSVPTERMRIGNFSGQSRRIYDPLTRVYTPDASGNQLAVSATQFPGNVIPSNRIHPVARKLLEFYPAPTAPGESIVRNYLRQGPRKLDWQQTTERVDFNESSGSFWFGRFGWGSEYAQQEQSFAEQEGRTETRTYQAMLSNTRTLSPSMVNEFRFGYTQMQNDQLRRYAFDRDISSELGMLGITPEPAGWGTPRITLGDGLTAFGEFVDGPFISRNHIFQWQDNLSIVKGAHSFKFGGELRRDRINEVGNAYPRGEYNFATRVASYDPANRLNTGHAFADFLLGKASNVQHAPSLAKALMRGTAWALYAEDIWKITPKLTLNLGLRYERTPPYHDKYRGLLNLQMFDPGVGGPNGFLPGTRTPVVVRPGEGDFYEDAVVHFHDGVPIATGDDILGRATVQTDKLDFAPRIGIAYSPNSTWSFRTGFGMFYAQEITNGSTFELARSLAGRVLLFSNSEIPNVDFSDPFAADRVSSKCSNWSGLCVGPGSQINAVDNARRTPYVYQWLFNAQRQITSSLVVEAGYLGSAGHRLEHQRFYNEPLLPRGLDDATPLEARRPWPALGRIQSINGDIHSNYHAFSTKATQRFTRGVTYMVGITWSKSIDSGSAIRGGGDSSSALNPYDFSRERGLSAFHVGRRLVASFVYELPVGRGKAFLGADNGVVDAFLGGWQISSILTLADGTPRSVGEIGDTLRSGRNNVPDATGSSPFPENRTPERFWNIEAFNATNPDLRVRYGNVARNTLFNPGTAQLDATLAKKFRIREGHTLDFRFEAFNATNHPNWNAPATDVRNAATFGVVQTARVMREMQVALKYVF